MAWSKTEKEIWEKSEVLQEFEKLMAKTALALSKQAQTKGTITQELDKVNKVAPQAAKSLGGVADAAKKLNNINFTDDIPQNIELPVDDSESETRKDLLNELKLLAKEASLSGNIKLAYTIERAMQEISQDE